MSPRRLFWPLHPLYVLAPAAAVLLVALVGTGQMWSWPYLHWSLTDAQWHQQFRLAGPMAAAAATLWATRLNRSSHVWVQPYARRLGGAVIARHLGILTAWYVGAYAVGMLPLTVLTALAGPPGGPDLQVIASGLVAIAAATAVGYAVGTVTGSTVAVPLVAVGAYLLDAVAVYGANAAAPYVPQLSYEPLLGESEPLTLALFRTVFFLTVATACAGTAAAFLRWNARGRRAPARHAAIVAGCLMPAVIVGVIPAFAAAPATYVADPAPQRSCLTQRGIEYCVHSGHAARLDQLVAAFDPVLDRYGTKPAAFTKIWDQGLLPSHPMGGPTTNGTLIAPLKADGSVDTLSSGLTATLLGFHSCPATGPHEDTFAVYRGLETYLRTGRSTGAFANMNERRVKQWIHNHRAQLEGCTLTDKDLPST
ncbi:MULTISPECIES: hypothetical protein [Prauserella salsuginis group]|uniref:Uncharacterized protein n=1 Tax=Prauserella salsuginis TaxID=387889 RepID=A0ABW6G006_9PSEU|nr:MULTISPECIES: hypothetical protein [Prauserella salsuginis group]MCR3721148.1 hypothetical protein [Prauserella flava]MCR3734772.1 hypothetical protein [Prauserella salsuginis]